MRYILAVLAVIIIFLGLNYNDYKPLFLGNVKKSNYQQYFHDDEGISGPQKIVFSRLDRSFQTVSVSSLFTLKNKSHKFKVTEVVKSCSCIKNIEQHQIDDNQVEINSEINLAHYKTPNFSTQVAVTFLVDGIKSVTRIINISGTFEEATGVYVMPRQINFELITESDKKINLPKSYVIMGASNYKNLKNIEVLNNSKNIEVSFNLYKSPRLYGDLLVIGEVDFSLKNVQEINYLKEHVLVRVNLEKSVDFGIDLQGVGSGLIQRPLN